MLFRRKLKLRAIPNSIHVGKTVMACGQLAEIKRKNRHYLNLNECIQIKR